MKIIAISDLHGNLIPIEEPADILIIAGDISPLKIQSNKPEVFNWLKTEFKEWIDNLPVEKVFLVAGNHDFIFESITQGKLLKLLRLWKYKVVYLKNSLASYLDSEGKEWTIFGTPYCHIFGNWPFMRSDEYMEEQFKDIPEEVDIIISHDPPFGVGFYDCILQRYNSIVGPQHIGNEPLRKQLENTRFKWLFCGHIHSGDHIPSEFNKGNIVNVSINDEYYEPIYKPFITEIL